MPKAVRGVWWVFSADMAFSCIRCPPWPWGGGSVEVSTNTLATEKPPNLKKRILELCSSNAEGVGAADPQMVKREKTEVHFQKDVSNLLARINNSQRCS